MADVPIPRVPLVGRGPELRELDEALVRALADKQPQFVTLIGSPGVGKTRLLHEFLQRVRDRERKAPSGSIRFQVGGLFG